MSTAARARFEGYDLDAQLACLDGVTGQTNKKQACYWGYWLNYLESIELDADPFLSGFSRTSQHRIIAGFGAAVRLNDVQTYKGASDATPPISSTVRATFDAVAQAFRTEDLPSPLHDASGKLAFILQWQLRGYTNKDASSMPQKAATPRILREMDKVDAIPTDQACSQLSRGAFFFAMRSCEYLSVSGERRTKLLCLENVQFFRNKKELPHDHAELHLADCVLITFVFQKNDERDATVTQHRTLDPVLCPVKAWSAIVKRILSYGCGPKTEVNTVRLDNGKLIKITSKQVLARLRAVVHFIGSEELGYKPGELGTHSIQSVFTIMLIGSDAFLQYICRQVQEFSSGVSSRMILSQDFFTIPDFAHHEDPRAPGHSQNFAACSNLGPNAQRRELLTASALNLCAVLLSSLASRFVP